MGKYSFLLLLISVWSCDIPKDPNETLNKIRNETLKVGISDSGKLSSYNAGDPKGEEVDIVKGFAETINAEIEWVPGSQEQIIELLKEYEVDIAIGGFTKKGPFKKHAGFTKPYKTEKIFLGAPAGTKLPDEVKDQRIAVEKGSMALVAVKKKKGIPVTYDSLPELNIPVAASVEKLQKLDLQSGKNSLMKSEHVLAIPKGENALLESLETYIDNHVRSRR